MATVPGRRALLIAAALVVVAVVGRGRCCCCAEATTTGLAKAARSEPLAYVPAGSADVVFDLDTREPLVALAVEQLAPRVTDGALTADQVHALVRRARRRGAGRRQGLAGLRDRRARAASPRRRGGRGA